MNNVVFKPNSPVVFLLHLKYHIFHLNSPNKHIFLSTTIPILNQYKTNPIICLIIFKYFKLTIVAKDVQTINQNLLY